MTQPYLGEIRLFAGNFAPKNNALCNGQIMSIQQNSALFSLLGTYYGGNGTTTFALPDFRSRIPINQGQGPGLTNYVMGEQTGTESVTITTQTMPMHNHMVVVSTAAASAPGAVGNMPSTLAAPYTGFWVQDGKTSGNPLLMDANMIGLAGGNQPHENRMPALAISMIIALTGIFPSRN